VRLVTAEILAQMAGLQHATTSGVLH
jgi:hypothetical protein